MNPGDLLLIRKHAPMHLDDLYLAEAVKDLLVASERLGSKGDE